MTYQFKQEELPQPTQDLLIALERRQSEEKKRLEAPKIHLRASVGIFAFFYEKIRNVVDYADDHLLRRRTIERILRRKNLFRLKSKELASAVIFELIMARYISNDWLPESKIDEVKGVIEKYIVLYHKLYPTWQGNKTKLADNLIGIASKEIEERLVSFTCEEAVIDFAVKMLVRDTRIGAKEEDFDNVVKMYEACHRAIVKSDEATIRFHLLKLIWPSWEKFNVDDVIKEVVPKFETAHNKIDRVIKDPASEKLTRLIKKYGGHFIILYNVLAKDYNRAQEAIPDPEKLEEVIREICKERYQKAAANRTRSVIRSLVYIFITKVLLALILEVPYEVYIVEQLRIMPLVINVLFPPLFMLLMASGLHVPQKKNTQQIVTALCEMIYNENTGELSKEMEKYFTLGRGQFLKSTFILLYALIYIIIFGLAIWGLRALEFNVISIIIFFIFFSTVCYFGFRIRLSFYDLIVVSLNEGAMNFILFDFIALPFVRLGRWISRTFSKINFFVFILDFLIEAPFKTFIGIIEEWVSFIKEKKEEIS